MVAANEFDGDDEQQAYIERRDTIRVWNPHLPDTCEQSAAIRMRKLSRNERFIGPAAELGVNVAHAGLGPAHCGRRRAAFDVPGTGGVQLQELLPRNLYGQTELAVAITEPEL
jgi:mannitol-1-phosphate 5-dehydrogenase